MCFVIVHDIKKAKQIDVNHNPRFLLDHKMEIFYFFRQYPKKKSKVCKNTPFVMGKFREPLPEANFKASNF